MDIPAFCLGVNLDPAVNLLRMELGYDWTGTVRQSDEIPASKKDFDDARAFARWVYGLTEAAWRKTVFFLAGIVDRDLLVYGAMTKVFTMGQGADPGNGNPGRALFGGDATQGTRGTLKLAGHTLASWLSFQNTTGGPSH